jgi:hypothetical protein
LRLFSSRPEQRINSSLGLPEKDVCVKWVKAFMPIGLKSDFVKTKNPMLEKIGLDQNRWA